MTFTKHTFPGLPNPVYLPSWIPVEIKIIPSSVAGWTSGNKIPARNFTSTTYHDTGNATSNANGEYTWAVNGGRRSAPGSYNGIFDASKLIITQRFDELVGHAANHTGNVTSYAYEHAGWGPAFSFEKSLNVGMWVHAGTLQAMGLTGSKAMYQHNFWSGKDCPGQIRRRGLWADVEKTVDQRIAEIEAFIAGGVPVVDPVPKPEPVPSPVVNLPKSLFGSIGHYSFNPDGPVSKAWLEYGKTTKRWPRLIQVVEGTPKYFLFSDGLVLVATATGVTPLGEIAA